MTATGNQSLAGQRAAEANRALLAGCAGPHEFRRVANGGGQGLTAQRWVCAGCGGLVNGLARLWYTTGIDHGQRRATRGRAA